VSGADLYEDGFPHGTPAGYERGCKGGACPSKVATGQSCRDASVRNRSDAQYRALVASGAPVEVLAQPEGAAAQAAPDTRVASLDELRRSSPRAREDRQLTPAPERLHTVPADLPQPVGEREGATGGEERPAGRGGAAGEHPRAAIKHGTVAGYQHGCRDDCPGDADGLTCRQAKTDYARERYAARRAERLAAQTVETPAPDHVTRVTRDDRHVTPDTKDTSTALAEDDATTETDWADLDLDAYSEHVYLTTHPETAALAESQAADDRFTAAIRDALDIDPNPTPPTTTEPRRSPEPPTPFDGMTGVMAELLRTAWLDGWTARQDTHR
jgi:hypothetical protein